MPVRQKSRAAPPDPAEVRRATERAREILAYYDEEWWARGVTMSDAKSILGKIGIDTSLFDFKVVAATACRKWLTADPKSKSLDDRTSISGREWYSLRRWVENRREHWRHEDRSPAYVAQLMRQDRLIANAHTARETMLAAGLPFTEFKEHPDVETSKKTVPVAQGHGSKDH